MFKNLIKFDILETQMAPMAEEGRIFGFFGDIIKKIFEKVFAFSAALADAAMKPDAGEVAPVEVPAEGETAETEAGLSTMDLIRV